MKVTIKPAFLEGTIQSIVSKSHMHRLLICAALSKSGTHIPCYASSKDILATAGCLNALGAKIQTSCDGFYVSPITESETGKAILDCGESGSTYRFLVPIICALNRPSQFKLSGQLPKRPMDELWRVLEDHRVRICGKGSECVSITGHLTPGRYEIPGDISSQFISGLLFALPLLSQQSEIVISGTAKSLGYIRMTLDVLKTFSVNIIPTKSGFVIPGAQQFVTPEDISPEGDWSNAAFWLCASAAGGKSITVAGLNMDTSQGDSAIIDILKRFGADVKISGNSVTVNPGTMHGININAGDIPDLVPAIAVAAAAAEGTTVIENVNRLRFKESNRLHAICETLNRLGGESEFTDDTIVIHGHGNLSGGIADSFGDHRIAMMGSVASVICKNDVIINGAQAVEKSYPAFFDDFISLGGMLKKEDENK
ncbi:MAG: 3-phosphoshikimate 1-carboxyvinyltransferase [Bacillota bacterium]|nr:3-phosphoshikimate 1-carboxyvinyltransferase [Bacillota bacterium]